MFFLIKSFALVEAHVFKFGANIS